MSTFPISEDPPHRKKTQYGIKNARGTNRTAKLLNFAAAKPELGLNLHFAAPQPGLGLDLPRLPRRVFWNMRVHFWTELVDRARGRLSPEIVPIKGKCSLGASTGKCQQLGWSQTQLSPEVPRALLFVLLILSIMNTIAAKCAAKVPRCSTRPEWCCCPPVEKGPDRHILLSI